MYSPARALLQHSQGGHGSHSRTHQCEPYVWLSLVQHPDALVCLGNLPRALQQQQAAAGAAEGSRRGR